MSTDNPAQAIGSAEAARPDTGARGKLLRGEPREAARQGPVDAMPAEARRERGLVRDEVPQHRHGACGHRHAGGGERQFVGRIEK